MKRFPVIKIACITTVLLLIADVTLSGSPATSMQSKAQKSVRFFNIQGFRIGMTMDEVKQVLYKRNIARYETGFSDLFTFSLAPGSEVRLSFSCTRKDYIVSAVELSVTFENTDKAQLVQRTKKQLWSKYGHPTKTTSGQDALDACWGQCNEAKSGTRLLAKIRENGKGEETLGLSLRNDALPKKCSNLRRKKINVWLYDWIAFVSRFEPGMTLEEASRLYSKRKEDGFTLVETPDMRDRGISIINNVVTEHEYFEDLDSDSQSFEGKGPGLYEFKFTGTQTGKKTLDSRLYSCKFTTTTFKNTRLRDITRKLARFIEVFGKPTDVTRQPGKLTARWKRSPITRTLEIDSKGLLLLEESNYTLRNAYRAAVVRMGKQKKKQFEKHPF